MTNRDYILKTCPYDLLMDINGYLTNDRKCVKELMEETRYYIKESDGGETRCIYSEERKQNISCNKCIQRWLNEPRI